MAFESRVDLCEEGVVDHPDCGAFFVDEPDGDACEGEAVDEVCRPV